MKGLMQKFEDKLRGVKLLQHWRFYNVEDRILFRLNNWTSYIYYLMRINWKKKSIKVIGTKINLTTIASRGDKNLNLDRLAHESIFKTFIEYKSNPGKYKRDWSVLDGGDLGRPWNE